MNPPEADRRDGDGLGLRALSESEYASVRTYGTGDSISPRAFPDVILAVADFMPPAGPDA